jgi:hypothetical protein
VYWSPLPRDRHRLCLSAGVKRVICVEFELARRGIVGVVLHDHLGHGGEPEKLPKPLTWK